jgi:hypothetical protein
MWGRLACNSGAVNSRYHSPPDNTAARVRPPNTNKVAGPSDKPLLGCTANRISRANTATSTASSASVSHGNLKSARPTAACSGSTSATGAVSGIPRASARAALSCATIAPIGWTKISDMRKVLRRNSPLPAFGPMIVAVAIRSRLPSGPVPTIRIANGSRLSQFAVLVRRPMSSLRPCRVMVRCSRPRSALKRRNAPIGKRSRKARTKNLSGSGLGPPASQSAMWRSDRNPKADGDDDQPAPQLEGAPRLIDLARTRCTSRWHQWRAGLKQRAKFRRSVGLHPGRPAHDAEEVGAADLPALHHALDVAADIGTVIFSADIRIPAPVCRIRRQWRIGLAVHRIPSPPPPLAGPSRQFVSLRVEAAQPLPMVATC